MKTHTICDSIVERTMHIHVWQRIPADSRAGNAAEHKNLIKLLKFLFFHNPFLSPARERDLKYQNVEQQNTTLYVSALLRHIEEVQAVRHQEE